MPRPPIWLGDNHVDKSIYPGHVLNASSSASGFPVERIADGRRDETKWRSGLTNAEVAVSWDCGTVRLASSMFWDRGHNLMGKPWLLEGSGDNFVTAAEVVLNIAAHPSVPGGRLEDPIGALALDGSWGIVYTPKAFRFWRIRIPAAAAFVPELAGVYSGRHFQFLKSIPMPYTDFDSTRFTVENETQAGRIGRSRTYRRRQGQITVRAGTEAEYADNFRPWIEDTFRDLPAPAWVVLDPDLPAETMMNVLCPSGATFAFAYDESVWPFPTAGVPFIENTPELV